MASYFQFWPMVILIVGLVVAIVCAIAFANSGNALLAFGIIVGIVLAILGIGLNVKMYRDQKESISPVVRPSNVNRGRFKGKRERIPFEMGKPLLRSNPDQEVYFAGDGSPYIDI